jgi:hypothetical protein
LGYSLPREARISRAAIVIASESRRFERVAEMGQPFAADRIDLFAKLAVAVRDDWRICAPT